MAVGDKFPAWCLFAIDHPPKGHLLPCVDIGARRMMPCPMKVSKFEMSSNYCAAAGILRKKLKTEDDSDDEDKEDAQQSNVRKGGNAFGLDSR
jgi:hypothetical protein